MTRTALIACLLLASGPAFAGEAPRAAPAPSTPAARISVNLCERDPMTQAAFRSEYGSNPVFVSADQVIAAHASGERWSAPRCMSARQHQQLQQRLAAR